LDTRQKIVSLDEAAAAIGEARGLTAIIGHFDPMTAAHARRILELSRTGCVTVVIVTDPPDPVLPLQARAELTAALATVDYVVPELHNTSAEIIVRLNPDMVIQEEAADLRRTQELVEHVHSRQAAKKA
jgi:glycerol-3-phosphate cytidylyltransferase-like family protein